MSYYVLNERNLEYPVPFNGVAVFYQKENDEKLHAEQRLLFQRLFESGLNMKLPEIFWMEQDPATAAFTVKNSALLKCCIFFGVQPSSIGFHVQLPLNKFIAVRDIQLLQTSSTKELNANPELKKRLWNAIQVLK